VPGAGSIELPGIQLNPPEAESSAVHNALEEMVRTGHVRTATIETGKNPKPIFGVFKKARRGTYGEWRAAKRKLHEKGAPVGRDSF
jgi:hypothetical protein